jgi:hypothetical protein
VRRQQRGGIDFWSQNAYLALGVLLRIPVLVVTSPRGRSKLTDHNLLPLAGPLLSSGGVIVSSMNQGFIPLDWRSFSGSSFLTLSQKKLGGFPKKCRATPSPSNGINPLEQLTRGRKIRNAVQGHNLHSTMAALGPDKYYAHIWSARKATARLPKSLLGNRLSACSPVAKRLCSSEQPGGLLPDQSLARARSAALACRQRGPR